MFVLVYNAAAISIVAIIVAVAGCFAWIFFVAFLFERGSGSFHKVAIINLGADIILIISVSVDICPIFTIHLAGVTFLLTIVLAGKALVNTYFALTGFWECVAI